MGALALLLLCFYAFIAWAPQQVQQMFLAWTWLLGGLWFVGMILYGLGSLLFA